jgi:hypothetical protein
LLAPLTKFLFLETNGLMSAFGFSQENFVHAFGAKIVWRISRDRHAADCDTSKASERRATYDMLNVREVNNIYVVVKKFAAKRMTQFTRHIPTRGCGRT